MEVRSFIKFFFKLELFLVKRFHQADQDPIFTTNALKIKFLAKVSALLSQSLLKKFASSFSVHSLTHSLSFSLCMKDRVAEIGVHVREVQAIRAYTCRSLYYHLVCVIYN